MDAGLCLEARCWSKRLGGTKVTCGQGLACQQQTGEPLNPNPIAPHFGISGPSPFGLTLSLPHSIRPGRPGSLAPAGPRGGGWWG